MPRKRRASTHTPLSLWIHQLLEREGITQRTLAEIAGVAPSVVNAWAHGAFPSEAVDKVKKLANHFNQSLTTVLTGEPDHLSGDTLAEKKTPAKSKAKSQSSGRKAKPSF